MNTKPRILVIEDESKIAQILVDFLQQDGFVVDVLNDGLHAVEHIKKQQPELVILDVMLPNKDGFSICKDVRQFSQVPILMLTARVDEIDRLIGLGFGADDYICKPFSAREVVARVHAVLRRTQTKTSSEVEQVFTYKKISLNTERFQCHIDKQLIDLTPVEFRLLLSLVKKPGAVFSRDSLMQASYVDDRIVSTRTIDSHMKNLRSKLIQAMPEIEILHSVYGIGYKVE
jgi:two-component system response regulator BaeR